MEETLARHGVPVTTLRAGLVIGGGGSSFEMLVKLVRRLPAMICPRWTQNRMQPIAVDDVVKLLAFVRFHAWVMAAFRRHLAAIARRARAAVYLLFRLRLTYVGQSIS